MNCRVRQFCIRLARKTYCHSLMVTFVITGMGGQKTPQRRG